MRLICREGKVVGPGGGAVALTLLAAACGDGTAPPDVVLPEIVVSSPVEQGMPGGGTRTVVYVSAPEGSAPGGDVATVRNLAGDDRLATIVHDGGFDPVAVTAVARDRIEIVTTDSSGATTTTTIDVKQRAPARVVRVSPGPHRTDVPLNAVIQVVFSSPVTLESVREGVRVTVNGSPVPGTVEQVNPDQVSVVFRPEALLAPATEHVVEVTGAVRGVNGLALAEPVTVVFRTSDSLAPASPDGIRFSVSARDPFGPGEAWQVPIDGWVDLAAQAVSGGVGLRDELTLINETPAIARLEWRRREAAGWHVARVGGLARGTARIRASAGAVTALQLFEVDSFTVDTVPDTDLPPQQHRLVVQTSTTGVNPDPDGYTVLFGVRGGPLQPLGVIGPNGSLQSGVLQLATYVIQLDGLAPNCLPVRNPVRTTPALVAFEVRCFDQPRQFELALTLIHGVDDFTEDADLYLARSHGPALQLTSGPGWDDEPAWSPDGNRLAFSRRDAGGESAIMLMQADGSSPVRLTNGGVHRSPTWSPDATRLAFASQVVGGWEIQVIELSTSIVTRLGPGRDPAWSPDGSRIAFVSDSPAPWIMLMDPDGSGVLSVVGATGVAPAWAPSGNRLAFVIGYGQTRCGQQVATVDLADPLSQVLHGGIVDAPAWSPDGRYRSYTQYPDFCFDIADRMETETVVTSAGRPGEALTSTEGHSAAFRPRP